MASSLAKWAGGKVFEKHLKRYEPADPVYETYVDDNGREKRRKVRPYYHRIRRHHQIERNIYLVTSVKFLLVYQSGMHVFSSPSKSALVASTPASTFAVSGSGGPSLSVRRATFTPGNHHAQPRSRRGPRCGRRTQRFPGLLLHLAKGKTSRVERATYQLLQFPFLN